MPKDVSFQMLKGSFEIENSPLVSSIGSNRAPSYSEMIIADHACFQPNPQNDLSFVLTVTSDRIPDSPKANQLSRESIPSYFLPSGLEKRSSRIWHNQSSVQYSSDKEQPRSTSAELDSKLFVTNIRKTSSPCLDSSSEKQRNTESDVSDIDSDKISASPDEDEVEDVVKSTPSLGFRNDANGQDDEPSVSSCSEVNETSVRPTSDDGKTNKGHENSTTLCCHWEDLMRERRQREDVTFMLDQLQKNYETLLQRFAEAENTIDAFRFSSSAKLRGNDASDDKILTDKVASEVNSESDADNQTNTKASTNIKPSLTSLRLRANCLAEQVEFMFALRNNGEDFQKSENRNFVSHLRQNLQQLQTECLEFNSRDTTFQRETLQKIQARLDDFETSGSDAPSQEFSGSDAPSHAFSGLDAPSHAFSGLDALSHVFSGLSLNDADSVTPVEKHCRRVPSAMHLIKVPDTDKSTNGLTFSSEKDKATNGLTFSSEKNKATNGLTFSSEKDKATNGLTFSSEKNKAKEKFTENPIFYESDSGTSSSSGSLKQELNSIRPTSGSAKRIPVNSDTMQNWRQCWRNPGKPAGGGRSKQYSTAPTIEPAAPISRKEKSPNSVRPHAFAKENNLSMDRKRPVENNSGYDRVCEKCVSTQTRHPKRDKEKQSRSKRLLERRNSRIELLDRFEERACQMQHKSKQMLRRLKHENQ